MTNVTTGKFVWHDLMTSDVPRSQRFYGDLFGWQTYGDADYQHIRNKDRDQGGMMKLDPAHGAPPHWLSYCSVDSVDDTVARANRLGGIAVVPPTDIQKVGRFAVLRDPQGAHLAPFQYGAEQPKPDSGSTPAFGAFCWDELLTTDPDKAAVFYGEIFGWKNEKIDMGPMGTYWLLKRSDGDAGGMMKLPPGAQAPPFWLPYVAVENVDATADMVRALGGHIHAPPDDIPGIGRFSVFADPVGATLAVYRSEKW